MVPEHSMLVPVHSRSEQEHSKQVLVHSTLEQPEHSSLVPEHNTLARSGFCDGTSRTSQLQHSPMKKQTEWLRPTDRRFFALRESPGFVLRE